ncbi:unnamed protein product, partial [marine sediment metagenome]
LCTDNAAMVASAGYYKFKENKKSIFYHFIVAKISFSLRMR